MDVLQRILLDIKILVINKIKCYSPARRSIILSNQGGGGGGGGREHKAYGAVFEHS